MTQLIEIRELSVRAGNTTILERVSLDVSRGEVVALIGPNGAGKSTLLRVLSGELRPQQGQVLLNGRPIDTYSPRALSERRAVLTQHTTVTFPYTVSEIVRMGAGQTRSRQWIAEASLHVMSRCDVSHLANQIVTHLSGGEQQRVHLARTMLQLEASMRNEPMLLLLDEPTASLDMTHQLMVLDIMRKSASSGTAVVVVLHDLNLAAMSASRIVIMHRGQVMFSGAPDHVINDASIEAAFRVTEAVGHLPARGIPFVLPQSMKLVG